MIRHNLRNGYTTGSCAAAAAKAAVLFLITGGKPDQVTLDLPGGESGTWIPVPVSDDNKVFGETRMGSCSFRVQKDAGDDPDVTNGSWIYVRAALLSKEELAARLRYGKGYLVSAEPAVYLDGGCGIGLVTREGLSCPPGHYAFNPVPREMIGGAVQKVCRDAGYREPLLITVAIPGGEELAKKTFNPRLGITGGLSVLGTTGIVRPMSEEALRDTICLELHMNSLAGKTLIMMTPGNYGETFLEEQMRLPAGKAVVCSNFVGDSAAMAAKEGIRRILFVGHIGKLIKVAAGMKNTHSRYGDCRMETIVRILSQVSGGISSQLREAITACGTTDEALKILMGIEGNPAQLVMNETARAVKAQMEAWSGEKVSVEVVVFSSALNLIGCTELAEEYGDQIRNEDENLFIRG